MFLYLVGTKQNACFFTFKIYFISFYFCERSLHSLGCPGTYYVDQVGLKLIQIYLPPPPKLDLKMCTTMPDFVLFRLIKTFIIKTFK